MGLGASALKSPFQLPTDRIRGDNKQWPLVISHYYMKEVRGNKVMTSIEVGRRPKITINIRPVLMYYNDFPFSCCVTQLFFLYFSPTRRRRSVVSADLLLIAHSTFPSFHHYSISSFSIILPSPALKAHSCWAPTVKTRDGVTPHHSQRGQKTN